MKLDPAQCKGDVITRRVHAFHTSVPQDDRLDPVFDAHIADWTAPVARRVDVWTFILRGSGRCSGAPMQVRQAMPELDPALFARRLRLFEATTQAACEPVMKARADELAGRIAQRLWLGWPMANCPQALVRASEETQHAG